MVMPPTQSAENSPVNPLPFCAVTRHWTLVHELPVTVCPAVDQSPTSDGTTVTPAGIEDPEVGARGVELCSKPAQAAERAAAKTAAGYAHFFIMVTEPA